MLSKVATILSILMVTVLGKSLRKDKNFDVVCHESEDGYAVFVPHPYDCSLYYECVDLTPVLMSCPAGLFFDSRIDVCNWPENVDCDKSKTEWSHTDLWYFYCWYLLIFSWYELNFWSKFLLFPISTPPLISDFMIIRDSSPPDNKKSWYQNRKYIF